ncbi:hypothetical protein [Micromonospora sp. U21]|uniref:hypothetical protein n=1 Tax=Micromonospora sp. U21 TaxID=2824899 RepID=UPI001B375A24|nr:hypothetical protein [Micromonospora sp. U21]MBQ0904488.1 hypothetical protein [Micromonospora sp. U21]
MATSTRSPPNGNTDSTDKTAQLVANANEIYYPGAPHGMTATMQDQVNKDLLAFLKELIGVRRAERR